MKVSNEAFGMQTAAALEKLTGSTKLSVSMSFALAKLRAKYDSAKKKPKYH